MQTGREKEICQPDLRKRFRPQKWSLAAGSGFRVSCALRNRTLEAPLQAVESRTAAVKTANRILRTLFVLLLAATCVAQTAPAPAKTSLDPQQIQDILSYIHNGWDTLTRSMTDCKTVVDPKAPEQSVLYLPAEVEASPQVQALAERCRVHLEHLPARITRLGEVDVSKLSPHGLLYLEHNYVVPGGMFNEMYGWDSYFIILGLLRDQRIELAQGMVENFFYEIEHYGAILNANRGYLITRSQPPFLTSMILAVYEANAAQGNKDLNWLAKAYDYAKRDYSLWMRAPHLAGNTGLSRYFDFGEGPVAELSATDPYYQLVTKYFVLHPDSGRPYIAADPKSQPKTWPAFSLRLCPAESSTSKLQCEPVQNLGLNADYYKGDRSMRESGFDISFRFEPFSAGTHHYAPVCLNSLLYKTERDLERISSLLGKKQETGEWKQRAATRAQKIQQYFWDQQKGMYFDYEFQKGKRSTYEYASTFYPLWAGVASAEQARAVARNVSLFEQPGGIVMSRNETKAQWDYPYGWAPVQLLAVEGLRRYGYNQEADRISEKFLSTVIENFRRDGTIREKYNVVTRSSETQVEVGYKANIVGFGWTNGVFLELLHGLQQKAKR
jgi:alpha,alpha-trehalase